MKNLILTLLVVMTLVLSVKSTFTKNLACNDLTIGNRTVCGNHGVCQLYTYKVLKDKIKCNCDGLWVGNSCDNIFWTVVLWIVVIGGGICTILAALSCISLICCYAFKGKKGGRYSLL